ncbi:MAG: tRNA-5-carboxymethylaminomethyl-2-thiouridine(34) synthesis protein MnmE [Ktedonobacterales bacterium]|jgi:tRNA modification GTPase|nr:MAG: tRNA-5-carboxymethylaminomethyl-2-thiouridine(34) synthesis protein MnmE [Ktedonobacterales bacterium]
MSTETRETLEAGQDDSRAAEDTIAAIATPPGTGGIGIVRVSGPEAFRIGMAIFRAADAVYRDAPPPSHLLTYGHVVDAETGERIDEVLAAFMRAPRTYTREDVVEISAHGGPLLLGRILRLALAAGARAARAGEMTLRAFLNGRLDLAQAEAVMALINAESDAGRRLALRQLQGELSARIGEARAAAMAALAHIEASIDFPEEEVPPPERGELAELVAEARGTVDALLVGAGWGRLLREGLRVALVGRPNVGKSSLLNALLRTERAIVTPIPGTTRDTVEERASIGGVALHLVDTAGLTATDDPIERIGVERSRAAARSADLLLFLLDRSSSLTEDDWRAADEVRALGDAADGETVEATPVIVALNKADLPPALTEAEARALWPGAAAVVDTSAVTAGGTEALERAVTTLIAGGQAQGADPLVASTRHADALRRADEHLAAALVALDGGIPLELVGIDLRAALDTLGEITGETASADLLDRIFAEFCIGK